MEITLKKPIKRGECCQLTINASQSLDSTIGHGFSTTEVVDGDSSAPTVDPASTAEKLIVNINGDGSLGEKKVRICVQGHIGKQKEGGPLAEKATQYLDVIYTVFDEHATKLTVHEGAHKAIPIVP